LEAILLIATILLVVLAVGPLARGFRRLRRYRRRRPLFAEYFPDDDPKRRSR
jgi:hypothetical protein